MSGPCSAHQGACPWDCHIYGERKRLRIALERVAENACSDASYPADCDCYNCEARYVLDSTSASTKEEP